MKLKLHLNQLCLLAALLPALTGEATTLVVTNTTDSGAGSLRQLIAGAAPGTTITFATNLSGATILLTSGQITLSNNITIDASALTNGILINGDGVSRVFDVNINANVVLTALTLTNGNDLTRTGGGGIYNAGNLTVNQCTLAGNNANNISTPAGGGAIFNSGTLVVNQSTLALNNSLNDVDGVGNYNGGGGGAIFNSGNLMVNQCTLTGNRADNGAGGGICNSGLLTVYNSIVAGNTATNGPGADIRNSYSNPDPNGPSGATLFGADLIQVFSGAYSGSSPNNAPPQLAPLGNYGGPTQTMPPLSGSPAINACVNSTNFTTDQRGVPRALGGISDIGSVQLAPPTVATLPATAAVNSNATLNATVNPNTLATTAWFQWGVGVPDPNNPSYASQTAPVAVGNGNAGLAFSNNLTGLMPGVVYHYHAVATNVDGSANGNDVLFGSAPVVTLFGAASVTNECHTVFTDPGATNALGLPVTVIGLVNTNAPNVYQLTYTVTNALGTGTAIRLVTVVDTTPPVIAILGANPLTILTNTPFVDPGATALDACGGSFAVTASNNVNTAVPGSYSVTYSSTDSYGNTATAVRTVAVRTNLMVAGASDFTGGNLVVVRVGDGSSSLSPSATSVYLMEYTPAGSLVQTIALPTAASGANRPFTIGGSTTSEGFLKLSVDGQHLTLAGYAATPGTASVAGTTAISVNRVVAVVNVHGAIDTTTALQDAYSGGNVRSAVSTDGTNFWLGGDGSVSSGAPRYTTLGTNLSTQICNVPFNILVVGISGGQLYESSGSGSFQGVSTVGEGEPTTLTTATSLYGLSISSSYDFWFKDSSTLYVTDDDAVSSAGGIQKWTLEGETWSFQYTLSDSPCRGLTGTVDGNGNAVLYATTATSSANTLIALTDMGPNTTTTILATAPTNTLFRGVAFAPGIPRLTIINSGNSVIVSWPTSSTGWTLQTNNDPATGTWGNYPGAVVNNRVTNSPPTGNLFFRLKQ